MQDKSKLGKRYQCFQCGLKFYDLNRPEPLCPKCGADQRENPNPDPREAILARFKGKSVGAAKPGFRTDEEFAEEEEGEEDVEIDEEDIDEEDEEIEGGAAAAEGEEED